MNSNQFRRWLIARGCRVESKPGGGGHLVAYFGNRRSQLPSHGGNKQLRKGLIVKILRELDINERPPN